MKKATSTGRLLKGHTDINGRPGIQGQLPDGSPIKIGGGEIIMSEKASTDNCATLSKMNKESGGIAFSCDEQKVANTDRASGRMPKDEYHQEAAGGAKADGYKYSKDFNGILIHTNEIQTYGGGVFSPFEAKGSFKAPVDKGGLHAIITQSDNFKFNFEKETWATIAKKLKNEGTEELELYKRSKFEWDLRKIESAATAIQSLEDERDEHFKLRDQIIEFISHSPNGVTMESIHGHFPNTARRWLNVTLDYLLVHKRFSFEGERLVVRTAASAGIQNETNVAFIIKTLHENHFYSERRLNFISLAPLVDLVIKKYLIYDKTNPIVTRFNESVYFEPSLVHLQREGERKAMVEYATHFITGELQDGNQKKRSFDKSKFDALEFLIPVLQSPDVQRLHQKADSAKGRHDAIVYAKEILVGNGFCVILIAEMSKNGIVRAVTFLPKNKCGYIQKQKAANVWLDAPVIFSPSTEQPPAGKGQIGKAGGGVIPDSNSKHKKNNDRIYINLHNADNLLVYSGFVGDVSVDELYAIYMAKTPIAATRGLHHPNRTTLFAQLIARTRMALTPAAITNVETEMNEALAAGTITEVEGGILREKISDRRKAVGGNIDYRLDPTPGHDLAIVLSDGKEMKWLSQSGVDEFRAKYPRINFTVREGGSAAGGAKIPDRYKDMGFTHVGHMINSTQPEKKWMVLAQKGNQYKVVHGGQKGMEDFSQHKDEARRQRFWKRMGGEDSEYTRDPFSPLYWHKKYGTW